MKQKVKVLFVVVMILALLFSMGVTSVFAEDSEWVYKAPMPTARYGMTSAVVDGKIYVIGGYLSGFLSTVEIYDPGTDTWSTGTNMPTARRYMSSAVVDGKVYVIGGRNTGTASLSTVEIYDPGTDTWSTGTDIPTRRDNMATEAVDGKIYVIGGLNSTIDAINKVEIYDPETDTWSVGANMLTARRSTTSAVVDGMIYVIGGNTVGTTFSKKVEVYDPVANTWSDNYADTPTATIAYCTSEVVNGKIYIIGGFSRKNTVAIYDPVINTWATGPNLNVGRQHFVSEGVDGVIYVIGGQISGGDTSSVEALDVGGVTPPALKKLAVLLNASETVQLSVTHNLADNADLIWSSTDTSVATVNSNGKVTAVSPGEADIYAESADGAFIEFIPVRVMEGADEFRLAVHLTIGQSAKLHLNDDPLSVTWSSFDSSVASVDSLGKVSAVARGLAIIEAEDGGEIYQIYVRVNM